MLLEHSASLRWTGQLCHICMIQAFVRLCLLSCCFQTQAVLKCTDADRLTTGTQRKGLEGAKLVTREENQIKGERQWNHRKPTGSRFLISSGIPQSSIFGPVCFGVDSITVTDSQRVAKKKISLQCVDIMEIFIFNFWNKYRIYKNYRGGGRKSENKVTRKNDSKKRGRKRARSSGELPAFFQSYITLVRVT